MSDNALRFRLRAAERRRAGKCPNCGGTPVPGKITCDSCIAKAVERRRRWRAAGKCVDCRVKTGGARRCKLCSDAHHEACAIRYSNVTP